MKFILVKKRRRPLKYRRYLYRLWQGDRVLFVGKTTQPLVSVLRRHFFGHSKNYRKIDVMRVTMIEIQHHRTIADCAIYLAYYINLYRPPYNRGQYEKDAPSITLPVYKWEQVDLAVMDRWIEQKQMINDRRYAELKERKHQWRQEQIMNQLGKNFSDVEQNTCQKEPIYNDNNEGGS